MQKRAPVRQQFKSRFLELTIAFIARMLTAQREEGRSRIETFAFSYFSYSWITADRINLC